MELMVTMAIGGILTTMVGAFMIGANKIQRAVTFRAELENYRSELIGQIDCSQSCAGLPPGKHKRGQFNLVVACHPMFKDATVTLETPDGKKLADVFTLEQSVCRTRRPKQCLYACHNQDILLERGYLYPSVSMGASTSDFRCPSGNLSGVDFSTNRIICTSSIELPPGTMCKQDVALIVGEQDKHHVAIAGKQPCSEHTLDQVRYAQLQGTLKVELAPGYTPLSSDRFEIIHAMQISGRFKAEKDTIGTDRGTFRIVYEKKKIFLTDFRPYKTGTANGPVGAPPGK
jgi:hypothetical protein